MRNCSRCKLSKLESEFYRSDGWKTGYHPYCKQCCKDTAQESRNKNPRLRLDSDLLRAYGITANQYDWLLASQGGCCKLCYSKVSTDGKRLAVDHDHETGEVRGILCNRCNRILGMVEDDQELLLRMTEYLARFS